MPPYSDVRLEYGSATAVLTHIEANGYVFHTLYSRERGKGHATGLMEDLCVLADRKELVIFLTVQQFGKPHDALTNKELEKFYAKFGFVRVPGSKPTRMIRYSKEE